MKIENLCTLVCNTDILTSCWWRNTTAEWRIIRQCSLTTQHSLLFARWRQPTRLCESCSHPTWASPDVRPPPTLPGIPGGCEWHPWGTRGREAAKEKTSSVQHHYFCLFVSSSFLTNKCKVSEPFYYLGPWKQVYGWHSCHTLLLLKADMVLMMCQSFATHLLRRVQIIVSQQTFNKLILWICWLDFQKIFFFFFLSPTMCSSAFSSQMPPSCPKLHAIFLKSQWRWCFSSLETRLRSHVQEKHEQSQWWLQTDQGRRICLGTKTRRFLQSSPVHNSLIPTVTVLEWSAQGGLGCDWAAAFSSVCFRMKSFPDFDVMPAFNWKCFILLCLF